MEKTKIANYIAVGAAVVAVTTAAAAGSAIRDMTYAQEKLSASVEQNAKAVLEAESLAYEKYYELKAEADEAARDGFYAEQESIAEAERLANSIGTIIHVINYEDYKKLQETKDRFLIEVSRDTCPYCMNLSYIIKDMDTHGIDTYVLNLEEYRGTNFYDEIKKEFGIAYVPTLFFIENGTVKYCMNSPLEDNLSNVTSADERARIRRETAEKVEKFILGAIGQGEVINEEPYTKAAEN